MAKFDIDPRSHQGAWSALAGIKDFFHLLFKEISVVKSYLGAWGVGLEVVSKKKKKKVNVNVKKKCKWSKVTRGLECSYRDLRSKMIVYQHDSAPHEENVEIQNFFLDNFFHLGPGRFYANSSYF